MYNARNVHLKFYLIPFGTSGSCWSCVTFNTLPKHNCSHFSWLTWWMRSFVFHITKHGPVVQVVLGTQHFQQHPAEWREMLVRDEQLRSCREGLTDSPFCPLFPGLPRSPFRPWHTYRQLISAHINGEACPSFNHGRLLRVSYFLF